MSVRYLIRGVAKGLLVLILFGATPVSTFAEAIQSPCTARHHQCDAPAISSCCCRDSGDDSLPATTDTGRNALKAPAALAPAVELALGTGIVVPRQAWCRVSTRCAGPPLPLHLLNVSILR